MRDVCSNFSSDSDSRDTERLYKPTTAINTDIGEFLALPTLSNKVKR
jgi:hypothetical protein